jgi:hypothetical protein
VKKINFMMLKDSWNLKLLTKADPASANHLKTEMRRPRFREKWTVAIDQNKILKSSIFCRQAPKELINVAGDTMHVSRLQHPGIYGYAQGHLKIHLGAKKTTNAANPRHRTLMGQL